MLPLARRLEALLFISPRPVAADRLAEACACTEEEAAAAVRALRDEYAAGAHGLELREVAGGFTFAVADDCAEDVRRFTGAEKPDDLTPALLETLAVVADS
jgi:segregation and condensation protein B